MESTAQIIRILAVSGSLRRVSSNTALLQAAIALSPPNIDIRLYSGLGNLPHFNPDLEPADPPAVSDLRRQMAWSDGLLISSPEYAHGVPGSLKNMLDWLVSGEEFVGKPIALFNASPRAVHAQASLIEVVTTMAGQLVPEASIAVALLGRQLDAAAIAADPEISGQVKAAIAAFAAAIGQLPPRSSPRA
ncbi:NADPH-dependent FMN reductase [Nodosilinea nodulosa]|uniref:NADPH-dependent FMN reductase n=1 Tax=Nodosilinea nodulosa TaxID=416001 RepID=UPI0002E49C38|nr:NAD(P)H-dependent oxidoreductase [Nodosilinea nodulosa]